MFRQNRNLLKALVSTALLTSALLSSSAFAVPTPAASPYARCISEGKFNLTKGQAEKAVEKFQAAVNADPASCEAHLLLGQSYCRLKDYTKAKQHFRAAIRVGKGSNNAQQANLAMMQLPKNILSPKTGPDTRMIASMLGLSRVRGADGVSKPTVIDFYAPWCQPCKQMNTLLDKVKSTYGDRVSFMRVDVDDPNNEKIIDQYEVSPIPTIVFLNPEGEVVTFSIGFSGEKGIDEGIKKILANKG
ncbi:MAG: tetratricopeptide repeat protein [Leptolyngbya sp.]|nr:tetratricopeptide repeat protein [Candidatus Melainabacteria bacterium]